jgi:hypothetical protein
VQSVRVVPTMGGLHAIPEGLYVTNPPVYHVAGACHIAVVRPLRGFRVAPGVRVRLYVVFHAIGAGRYDTPRITVGYSADGSTYTQTLPIEHGGSVSQAAKPIRPAKWEKPCLEGTTALRQPH